MHLKRNTVEKTWPITRKGTKYLIVPNNAKKKGIPLLVVMREMLELVKTRKELKKIINEGKLLVNEKPIKEDKSILQLFDVLSLPVLKKTYRLTIGENKKFSMMEIKDSESKTKISKIIGKKVIKGNKIQINLSDGRNILSDEQVLVGDSVEIEFDGKKIKKVLQVKEKSKVLVIKGKHMGQFGEVKKIEEDNVIIESGKKEIKITEEEIIVLS
jgi:small subunit ribosomal protein S4e